MKYIFENKNLYLLFQTDENSIEPQVLSFQSTVGEIKIIPIKKVGVTPNVSLELKNPENSTDNCDLTTEPKLSQSSSAGHLDDKTGHQYITDKIDTKKVDFEPQNAANFENGPLVPKKPIRRNPMEKISIKEPEKDFQITVWTF